MLKILIPSKRDALEYDVDVLVRIIYYILLKTPEYGNINVLMPLLKLESEHALSFENNDSLSRSQKPEQIIQDTVQNSARLIFVLRSFLLLLADVEDTITGLGLEVPDSKINNSDLITPQKDAGSVIVEGKLSLMPPNYPNFTKFTNEVTLESLAFIRNPENAASKVVEFHIHEISHVFNYLP